MKNMQFLFLALAIFSVQYIEVILKHADCPEHEPYYTDVGCVYRCPHDLNINGSSCVVTCGEWFTDQNKICLSECPINYFVRKEVKVIGKELYLEKQCVLSCGKEEFIFNGTCVEACPINLNYISNKTCTHRCPNGFQYLENFTKVDILYHECYEICPFYEEDNYCVNACVGSKVLFELKCTEKCPTSHQFLYRKQCSEHCPTGIDVNKTCVNSCPSHLSFIYNNSCIANCPRQSQNVEVGLYGLKVCVNVCGQTSENIFLFNKTCVSKCPFLSVNTSCTETCPEDNPIVNNVTIGRKCYNDNQCANIFQYSECVSECSNKTFLLLDQNTCVKSCPNYTVLYNRTCLNACEENAPFSEETTIDVVSWSYFGMWYKSFIKVTLLQCVGVCSESSLKLDKTCVKRCPGESELPTHFVEPWNKTSQFFRFGRTCVRECPESHPFIGRSYVKKEKNCHSWMDCDDIIWYLECLAECPENTYMYKNICLNFCPDHLFLLGNNCVDSCPQTQNILMNREINVGLMGKYFSSGKRFENRFIIECIIVCEKRVTSNNTCVDFCTLKEPYINGNVCHNNSCGSKYELETLGGIECLGECPLLMVQNENKCTSKCPDELKYNYQSVCVKECPQSRPFGIDKNADDFYKEKYYICIEKCEDDLVYKKEEEACIPSYRCDDPHFIFQGQCLQRCPEGYTWFLSCFHVTSALTCCMIMTLLTVIYCACCMTLFKEVHDFIKICCMFSKYDRGQDNAKNLLHVCLQEIEETDEPINGDETENIGAIDSADTCAFQVSDNGFINDAFINDALETETLI